MAVVTMNSVWYTCITSTTLFLCSLFWCVHTTPMFSPDLFQAADGNKRSGAMSADCPRNPLMTAQMCTAKLRPLQMQASSNPSNDQLENTLRDGCAGGFQDAVNCMERVILDCRHATSESAQRLRSSMDVDKARQSIRVFCTNLDDYIENLPCIQGSVPYVRECGQEAKSAFMAQQAATPNIDTTLQCRFFSAATSCLDSVLHKRCGSHIGDIVYQVMAGMEPPVCKATAYSISSQTGGRRKGSSDNSSVGLHSGGISSYLHWLGTGVVLLWLSVLQRERG